MGIRIIFYDDDSDEDDASAPHRPLFELHVFYCISRKKAENDGS